MSTTLTTKGQVTIPKNVRDYLGLRPGDLVDFEFDEDGSVRLHPARRATKRKTKSHFAALVGIRHQGLSTDALMEMLRGYSEDKDDPGFR